MTVEFDLSSGSESVEDLKDLLELYLAKKGQVSAGEAVPGPPDPEQIRRLRRLSEGLTEKQLQVWHIFMENPGPIAASRLKGLLPELKHPGALPGVFRAAHRWVTQLAGDKKDCPFTQVRWTGSEGIYRGLTLDEVQALQEG